MERIDVHHHFIPKAYRDAVLASPDGDPSGWKLPTWTKDSTLQLMKTHRIGTAILSLTSPGSSVFDNDLPAASALCREVNKEAASIRDSNPNQFGFFAALPPALPDNVPAVLDEITHSLDNLHADGVTLFTRYGPHYLGHASLRPIWAELNRRSATAFVHPTHSASHDMVSASLPQPIIDYPHETTRTAVDLIVSGTTAAFPNVRIILSHAGGSLPWIAMRAAQMADAGLTTMSAGEFLERASDFYFDVALSSGSATLELLLGFAKKGHVLFGSDFPYAPTKTIGTFVGLLEEYEGERMDERMKYEVSRGAALELFPRLKGVGQGEGQ